MMKPESNQVSSSAIATVHHLTGVGLGNGEVAWLYNVRPVGGVALICLVLPCATVSLHVTEAFLQARLLQGFSLLLWPMARGPSGQACETIDGLQEEG